MRLAVNRIFLILIAALNLINLSCKENDKTVKNENFDLTYHQVNARKNADDPVWQSYTAKTIDRLPNFNYSQDPETDIYGGWKIASSNSSGFFKVEKKDNRWWIIDPNGNPFIHKGVAAFRPGLSANQKLAFNSKYGSEKNWAVKEIGFLKAHGFNGTGAWSNIDLLRNTEEPLVYSLYLDVISLYHSQHVKKYGSRFKETQNVRHPDNLLMVFDPEFDDFLEREVSKIAKYKNDRYLLGYFTDNNLVWVHDALDQHLKYLDKNDAGYLAAKTWFSKRKGKEVVLADINDEDRTEFVSFYFETYIKKVEAAIRKYDPNHLYLGSQFNQELVNSSIMEIAGKYADIISINFNKKWQPDQADMYDWVNWSGKPFLITEFYTKGEDSGLPNRTGAGWNVSTQLDRGYFYQNFAIELLKSKGCVGWHWFAYQDNDPLNLRAHPLNRDSNKGIVNSNYEPYKPLLDNMRLLNKHTFQLIQYLDSIH